MWLSPWLVVEYAIRLFIRLYLKDGWSKPTLLNLIEIYHNAHSVGDHCLSLLCVFDWVLFEQHWCLVFGEQKRKVCHRTLRYCSQTMLDIFYRKRVCYRCGAQITPGNIILQYLYNSICISIHIIINTFHVFYNLYV